MSRRFAISPTVVSETIDGEAVIMNLQTGHYFSARGTGALVWGWLSAGAAEGEVVSALAARYSLDAADVGVAVGSFVSALQLHELVVDAPGDAPHVAPAPAPGPERWSMPSLDAHTDMEDLLLLDPIHDVGEAGWPMPKAPGEHAA